MKELLIRVRGWEDSEIKRLLAYLQSESGNCSFVCEEGEECTQGGSAQITKILQELGIPAKLKGFYYLQTALDMCMKDRTLLMGVTKCLYPEVGKACDSDVSKVEHAIRHAILRAWERNSSTLRDEMFRNSIGKKQRPTNAAFLATVTDYLLLQEGARMESFYPEDLISS